MAKDRYIFDEKTATFVPHNKPSNKKWLFAIPVVVLLAAVGIFFGTNLPINKTNADIQKEKELMLVKNQYKALQKELSDIESSLSNVQEKDKDIYRRFFQMDTLSGEERKGGSGGTDKYSNLKNLDLADVIVDVSKQADAIKEKLKVQSKSLDQIKQTASEKSKDFLHIPAIQPIANKDLTRIASGFGMRKHPILGIVRPHEGLDFTAPIGTPIYATANGVVEIAGRHNGFGNTVTINHENGYETLYAHLSKIAVSPGKNVSRGQVIGYVGTTGLSTGPHLHYEIKKDGVKINPITYFYNDLSAEQYKKLLEISQISETSWD